MADLQAMRRACQRVVIECDIALEASRRAERIVKRIMPSAHPFERIEATPPIKRRIIQKIRAREGLVEPVGCEVKEAA